MKSNEKLVQVVMEDKFYDLLKERAKRNLHSLGKEGRIIIESALLKESDRVKVETEIDADVSMKLSAMAQQAGVTFETMCERVITNALVRNGD